MDKKEQSQVALFVDFENLVYGVKEQFGDQYEAQIDADVLVRLAAEYGQVVLAHAYADWRHREVNQFQVDLYRVGMDLVHVFGKSYNARVKNAVDVKMAVDAVETLFVLPHISVFVIVSGDRDFIHMLKTLRRHGKTVIGISPENSVSEDFAALCDRFVRYGALAKTYQAEGGRPAPVSSTGPSEKPSVIEPVRAALRAIVAAQPSGIKGAAIKPALRQRISSTFDESEYGFSRLTDLLHALPDVVRVVPNPHGGDVTVYPADVTLPAEAIQPLAVDPLWELKHRAKLSEYKFVTSATRRRYALRVIYDMLSTPPFTWSKVFERILNEHEELGFTTASLTKHFTVLWQSRFFQTLPEQEQTPLRERLMSLQPMIGSADDFQFRYEAGILYKLAAAAKELGLELNYERIGAIFGLDHLDPAVQAYCDQMLAQVAQTVIPTKSDPATGAGENLPPTTPTP